MTEQNHRRHGAYIDMVERKMQEVCATTLETTRQKTVLEAMRYSLEAGGKRVRPVLVFAFCEMCGGTALQALMPAVAIEMLHTFSLIHDDLPAMDDDDYRRGRYSCHKAYNEAIAVLAGDALSVYPFELLARDNTMTSQARVRLIAELAHAIGVDGMIGGQVVDMENETRDDITTEDLKAMYALKTGALIRIACRMGCIVAGADEETCMIAGAYADCIGLAFQIVDDILDVVGSQELIGKPIGSDAAQNKTTFVTLLGLDGAKEEAKRLTEEAKGHLAKLPNPEFLLDLTDALLNRQY